MFRLPLQNRLEKGRRRGKIRLRMMMDETKDSQTSALGEEDDKLLSIFGIGKTDKLRGSLTYDPEGNLKCVCSKRWTPDEQTKTSTQGNRCLTKRSLLTHVESHRKSTPKIDVATGEKKGTLFGFFNKSSSSSAATSSSSTLSDNHG